IAQLQALIKAFPKEPERGRRVHAHLEIGALALQFYSYALAKEHFLAALAEAQSTGPGNPGRPDLVEQAFLSLVELAETLSDPAGLDEAAALAQKLPLAEDVRYRGWCAAAESRLYRSGATAAGAWLDQTAETTSDRRLKCFLYRLAARGYAQSGILGPAANELDKASHAIADDHSMELAQTALQYRIDEAIAGGATPDAAMQTQLPAMKKLLEAEIALSTQQPAQSPWSKYWQDRAGELEPKQPGRAYAGLQAALYEQALWRLATEDLRADLFSGQPLDYSAGVDIAKDKFTLDRNKLWDVAQSEMSPPWELHAAEPMALDSMTNVFEGEKGGGEWKPVKDEWYHMLNIEGAAPLGVYHARTTIQIPATPAPGLKIWLGLNSPGKIWIDGKLVFEQTRFTKSQYDMAALPASDFKAGPHKVMVKLIHSRRDQRRRASVRVSTMSAFRVYLHHEEAAAVFPNYRELWTLQDRLQELAGNFGEFLSFEGLALASYVRAQLAGGSQDYAIDRAIGSVDAAMRAPDAVWAGRIIDDVAWRLEAGPRADHRNDSIFALLERWRNLGLNEYNLADLERAQRYGLCQDTHGRGGAFGVALRAEVQGLLGNLEGLQEAVEQLKTEYADCDNAMASAGLLLSRLGRRERAQRDFTTSDEATADIEDAQRMIEQEEYKRALARLLKAADQHGDKHYRVEGGRSSSDGRLVSVRTFVHDMIGIMPAVLWPIYAETYDTKSLSDFAAAERLGTLEGYLAVADRYPYSAGSLKALNLAGALAVDAGEADRAAVFYARLLDETQARAKNSLPAAAGSLDATQIRFKRADALCQAGRGADADLKTVPPGTDAKIVYHGQSVPLDKLWNTLSTKCAAPPPAGTATAWRSLRGSLEQAGRVDAELPSTAPVLAWEGQSPWISDADAVAANVIPAPYFAGLQTAAIDGDNVLSSGDAGLIVRRLTDGRRLWSQEWNDRLLHLEEQGRVIDFTGVPLHCPDVVNGVTAARVIVDGHGALEARRLNDGRLLASTRTIDELKNFHAFGEPVLADGLLIGRFLSIRDSGAL
ncbi:MAG TPA: hypothetical protein VL860_10770, partial [Planctomycetota bacterium]|nr:hypothetical protein [Planctomycetota bacterium]